MATRFATILFIFLFTTSASGQLLNFEVVKGSKKLGDMTVERKSYNNDVKFEVKSKVVFRLLFSFTIDFESSALYKNGILEYEKTNRKLNGSTQTSSLIEREGNHYKYELDGVDLTENELITYSIAAIYFQEPKANQRVFSPQFGQYLVFEKQSDHVYKLESPDGTNTYTYINGICTEVKVSRDFATFYFKMTPETLLVVKDGKDF